MLILNGAFLMVIIVSLLRVAMRESIDTRKLSSRPETFRVILVLSLITSGLAFKLCGAIGVIANASVLGTITGPPQLKE